MRGKFSESAAEFFKHVGISIFLWLQIAAISPGTPPPSSGNSHDLLGLTLTWFFDRKIDLEMRKRWTCLPRGEDFREFWDSDFLLAKGSIPENSSDVCGCAFSFWLYSVLVYWSEGRLRWSGERWIVSMRSRKPELLFYGSRSYDSCTEHSVMTHRGLSFLILRSKP